MSPNGLPSPRLESELARYCLPSAHRDDTRRLAWANSICLLFLVVATLGLKQPVFVLREVQPRAEPLPVTLLPPPTEPEPPPAIPRTTEDVAPASAPDGPAQPAVVPVVVAADDAVSFSVPVERFTTISREPQRVPPPPAIVNRPPAPPPPPRADFRAIRFGGKEFRKQPPPGYPEEFRRSRVGGTVEALITIGTNGLPSSVTVGNSSGSSALDRHVCDFIRREWKADPGEIAHYRIAITFLP